MTVLEVCDLSVSFTQNGAKIEAVKAVSFGVGRGEVVALVGESGSGKSVTALSTVSLLNANAEVTGSVLYEGKEMVGASEQDLQAVRGNDISFIFENNEMIMISCNDFDNELLNVQDYFDLQIYSAEITEYMGLI